MATVPQTPVNQRGRAMAEAWGQARGYASRSLERAFRFFTSYPPLAQGLYYLLLGLWPLLGISSYQAATGHEQSPWMAQAVGVLLLVIGCALCLAAYRRQGSPEVLFIAFGSALGLAGVDVHLAWRGYSLFYLLDAVLQVGLVAFWVYGWRKARRAASMTAAAVPPRPPA
jgi:uncharacterized membrane protein SirB2